MWWSRKMVYNFDFKVALVAYVLMKGERRSIMDRFKDVAHEFDVSVGSLKVWFYKDSVIRSAAEDRLRAGGSLFSSAKLDVIRTFLIDCRSYSDRYPSYVLDPDFVTKDDARAVGVPLKVLRIWVADKVLLDNVARGLGKVIDWDDTADHNRQNAFVKASKDSDGLDFVPAVGSAPAVDRKDMIAAANAASRQQPCFVKNPDDPHFASVAVEARKNMPVASDVAVPSGVSEESSGAGCPEEVYPEAEESSLSAAGYFDSDAENSIFPLDEGSSSGEDENPSFCGEFPPVEDGCYEDSADNSFVKEPDELDSFVRMQGESVAEPVSGPADFSGEWGSVPGLEPVPGSVPDKVESSDGADMPVMEDDGDDSDSKESSGDSWLPFSSEDDNPVLVSVPAFGSLGYSPSFDLTRFLNRYLSELIRDGDMYAVRDALALARIIVDSNDFFRIPGIALVSAMLLDARFGDNKDLSLEVFLRSAVSDFDFSLDVLSSLSGGISLFGTDSSHFYKITSAMYEANPDLYERMVLDSGKRGSTLIERNRNGNIIKNNLIGMPCRADTVDNYLFSAYTVFRAYRIEDRRIIVKIVRRCFSSLFERASDEQRVIEALGTLGKKDRAAVLRWANVEDSEKDFLSRVLPSFGHRRGKCSFGTPRPDYCDGTCSAFVPEEDEV